MLATQRRTPYLVFEFLWLRSDVFVRDVHDSVKVIIEVDGENVRLVELATVKLLDSLSSQAWFHVLNESETLKQKQNQVDMSGLVFNID